MKVIIVGAGPAGLFAAYQLVKEKRSDLEIILIEKGNSIKNRKKNEVMSQQIFITLYCNTPHGRLTQLEI